MIKKNNNIVVLTDLQLQNCMDSKSIVEIWIAGCLETVGVIIDFNSDSIKIESGRYLRTNCILKTNNYFRSIS